MNELENEYISTYQKPHKDRGYFLLSVKPVEKFFFVSCYSVFLDFSEKKHEIRQLDLVNPENLKDRFINIGQNLAVIENATELNGLINIGGHALIEHELMEKNWGELLLPQIVANTYDRGFVEYNIIEKTHKQRFLKGKSRMEIFVRDGMRCRICGVSEEDGIHIRLEIHHIKPWEEGGLSEPENVITLCELCHGGIKVVDRQVLYEKIGIYFPNQNHLIYDMEKVNLPFRSVISNSILLRIKKRPKTP